MKINRFPKMAALQKERAKALGYDEEMAKAIGYAEAKKYAIFKNMNRRRSGTSSRRGPRGRVVVEPQEEFRVDPIFRLTWKGDLPIVGDEVITAETYDRYMSRFPEEVREQIEAWARDIISKVDEGTLRVETRFFNSVWKTVRDQDVLLAKAA